jgi:hypothetical protein
MPVNLHVSGRAFSALFFLASSACAAPVISNIRADFVSHSSIRLLWDNSQQPNAARVRFGFTPAYDAGPGGAIFVPATASNSYFQYGLTISMSGLAAGSTYHFCPQASADGGNTWSDCQDFVLTLPPLPSPHPALPVAPVPVDVTFPTQSGGTLNVALDCSDLQTILNSAQYGETILIPAGAVCGGAYTLPNAPEAKTWLAANIQTSTATIALPGHGFTAGQLVRIGANSDNGDALPGSAGANPFVQTRGIKQGVDYYVIVVDADHFRLSAAQNGPALDFSTTTFTVDPTGIFTIPVGAPLVTSSLPMDGSILQMKSTGTLPAGLSPDTDYCVVNPNLATSFQLRLGSCSGAAVVPANVGSGTYSFVDRGRANGYIMSWPPENNWIVVRTSTPDTEFCPDGVRCLGSIWQGKMATFLVPTPQSPMSLMTGTLSHNWRFVGLEFTHADASAEVQTSTDPAPFQSLMATNGSNGYITLDRCYIHGLGYPNRLYRAIQAFDGDTMSIVNSDLERLDYWHPYRTGVQPSTVGNTVVISAGTYAMGAATATLPASASIAVSGTGSGTGVVYFNLSGALQVVLPPGVSGICYGYSPCSVSSAAGPGFPLDAGGRLGVGEVATIGISNGLVTSAVSSGEPSVNDTEGAQSFVAGLGPGPFLIQNNLISGTGIPMHFDDSGSGWAQPHDYTIRRNLFTSPLSQLAGGPGSDGLRYYHRNDLEFKNGSRILVEGNIFENNFGDVTPTGSALMLTTRTGGFTSDVKIAWNTFQNSAGGLFLGPVDSYDPVSAPVARVEISNNLLTGIDGNLAVQPLQGFTIGIGYSLEDVVLDHNAIYNPVGGNPSFLFVSSNMMEGVALNNSLLWVNNDSGRLGLATDDPQGCSGYGRSMMDCVFVSGVGNPAYQFLNNLLVAGWTDSKDSLYPIDPSVLASTYSGLGVAIGQPASIQQLQAGGQGPDPATMIQVQGQIGAPAVQNLGSLGVDIAFSAPDPGNACYVLYGTGSDPSSFSRTSPDTSNTNQRVIHLSSLVAASSYTFTVLCSGASQQPFGSFSTPAAPPFIASVSPSVFVASNSIQSLALTGTGFSVGSALQLAYQGAPSPMFATITNVSGTQMQATANLGVNPGNWTVTVINPGVITSNSMGLSVVAPAPTITSISPSTINGSASAQPLVIAGTGFEDASGLAVQMTYAGASAPVLATILAVSGTQIQSTVNVGTVARNWSVQVINPDGGVSNSEPVSVVARPAAPTITALNPNPLSASGSAQALQISGTGFTSGLTVTLRAANGSATVQAEVVSVSDSQISALVSVGATAQTWTVQVVNPGRLPSNLASLTVQPGE